jgi:hypothetical protein
VDRFNITVDIAALPITPPREGDWWFMQHVMDFGVVTCQEELVTLNRVRCHQQVFFLSDILEAGGNCLDRKYLSRRMPHETWSTLTFPLEKPNRSQIKPWEQVLFACPEVDTDTGWGGLFHGAIRCGNGG